MSEAAISLPGLAAMSDGKSIDNRIQAEFWQSPFAVCSGLVVCLQAMILLYAAMIGAKAPYEALMSLTMLASMMLAAGIWPNWNYLSLSGAGVEQHAGLTGTFVPWTDVKAIDQFDHGVDLQQWVAPRNSQPYVRTVRLFNRYGMSPKAFADMVDTAWRKGAGHQTDW